MATMPTPAPSAPQLELPGFGAAEARRPCMLDSLTRGRRAAGYGLFMALLPTAEDAARIHDWSKRLHEHLHLDFARAQTAERLHITLLNFNDHLARLNLREPSDVYLQGIANALQGWTFHPLPIRFNRALRFEHNGAFVLGCDADSSSAIARLRQQLLVRLHHGERIPRASSTPHMTLQYAAHGSEIPPLQLHPPLEWCACRMALILSHRGATHHQHEQYWSATGSSSNTH